MSAESVLVVDDQPHVIRVIRLALERKGYRVDSALNGSQALDKLSAADYDVLITDIDMPQMNGRELCDELHARGAGAPPLTFVVSGSTEPDLQDWAASHARTFCLEKPLSLKSLMALLEEHLHSGALA